MFFHADSTAGKKKLHQVEPQEAPQEDISSVLAVMKGMMTFLVKQQKAHMGEVRALREDCAHVCRKSQLQFAPKLYHGSTPAVWHIVMVAPAAQQMNRHPSPRIRVDISDCDGDLLGMLDALQDTGLKPRILALPILICWIFIPITWTMQ